MTATQIHVLHADDEPDFGELTATFLERENQAFTVTTETNADDALTRLADEAFDAIVSDYDMPGMNGIEFLEAVREEYPDIPFILYTGKGSEEVASDAISSGVTDYLQKGSGSDHYTLLANRIENAVDKDRAEYELDQARQTYKQVARLATDAFWMWDLKTDEIRLSDGFEEVFGHAAGTIENGYDWAVEHVHPDDRDAVVGDVQATVDDNEDWSETEYRFRRGDGSYTTVRSRRSAIAVGDDGPERVVGVLTDLTEQNSHTCSLTQYKTALEALPDAVWMVDSEGVLRFLNQSARTRLGLSQEDIIGHHYRDILEGYDTDPETNDDFAQETEAVLRNEVDLAQTEFIVQHDERPAVRDILMAPVSVDDETWAVGVSRDITARKQAEDRFKSLFENISDPIVAVTYDGDEPILSSVNEAFERAFDYDADSATGQSINDLIVPDAQTEEAEEIDTLMRSGERVEREVVRRTSDGALRNFMFQVVHTEEDNDQQVFYGVYRDITELKRYSERLEDRNERLDAFAEKVAHDLRNPVTTAEGWLELARENADSTELERINEALERVEAIISDVLALAQHGDDVLQTVPVDPTAVTEQAWRMSGRESASLTVDEYLGPIEADETRLTALFENLFRNAIEHGGREVTIQVGPLTDEEGFYVEDDGPGIPKTDREQVFESGYTTADTGTGFGLAIVSEIGEGHGWTISATEGATGGARFEIRV